MSRERSMIRPFII